MSPKKRPDKGRPRKTRPQEEPPASKSEIPGRNDPCWCGSGKKYKHCHLAEDEAREREGQSPAPPPAPPAAPAPDPEEMRARAEAEALWERFEQAPLEDKIEILEAGLEQGDLDGDDIFEMMLQIREGLDPQHSAEGRRRYAELVDQARQSAPEAYDGIAMYLLENRLRDVAAGQDWAALDEVAAELTPRVTDDIDIFSHMVDLLLYHGKVRPLQQVMEQAWPAVQDSGDILPHGIQEFSNTLLLLNFFEYLEQADERHPDAPALQEDVEAYGGFRQEWLEQAIQHLQQERPSPWQVSDFEGAIDADTWKEHLRALFFEWMAGLQHREGTPLSKSYMATTELGQLLETQLNQRAMPSKKSGRKKAAAPSSLIPGNSILDRELGRHFHFINPAPYRVCAALELLPDYLHFVAQLGLISRDELQGAFRSLGHLARQAIKVVRLFGADLNAVQALERAWSEENLAGRLADPDLVEEREIPTVPEEEPVPEGQVRVYTFKVTYMYDREVWRTIEIAASQTLEDLHWAIQEAVDFDDDHLYSFFMSGKAWDNETAYSSPYADGPSAAEVRIDDLNLREKQRFLYLFDYGDKHRFEVKLLAVRSQEDTGTYPHIVERHGKNPQQYIWYEEDYDEDEFEDD
ncbi:MAG: SEC-C domain-containing protein [Chloroflexia bacterium]|nr:SEC-C domain-containing protein [Chloroflexia bacterium]